MLFPGMSRLSASLPDRQARASLTQVRDRGHDEAACVF
jgi:hypothetical protein